MSGEFHQQTILITGAAGSLGSALALVLARRGAELVLLDRESKRLEALHDRICDEGLVQPVICVLDLMQSGPGQFESLVSMLETECAGLHALVHCAAAFEGLQPMDQIQPDEWQRVMNTNLNVAWLLSVSCLPLLRRVQSGKLCFTLDDPGREESAYWGAYGVSKAGIRALTKILIQECSGSTVQVYGFNPGPMKSELRAKAYLAENPQSLPAPEEAAQGLVSLISPVKSAESGFYDLNSVS